MGITERTFPDTIRQGIPEVLPDPKPLDPDVEHAPVRKDVLNEEEKILALANALRYFPTDWHDVLAPEFAEELMKFGRIYMYRFRPDYRMYARPVTKYPAKCLAAASIMLMIQNNLDPAVAQHPHELITYGGNGAVFQNWAQYLLTMKYLSEMEEDQTLHMYSGHPMGLFPSSMRAPRVVVTNGMMIPSHSTPDDWEKYNALGVTQYGQMTAGSYMYIGPQGIVHGTTITLLNAKRRIGTSEGEVPLFLSSGLGGMSGAQPKAGNIAGYISVIAEVNEKAARKRHKQGWVDELIGDLPALVRRVMSARKNSEIVSLAFLGNIVDVWEYFEKENIKVDVGSDQTSLHNPWSGGYYPAGFSLEESRDMIKSDPEKFRECVRESLRRQAASINHHAERGTYFFDYGNAFLLEASRAGAEIMDEAGKFTYPSYVQDIMGPMCFDYGFGPFRWVCLSNDERDLELTDRLAAEVLDRLAAEADENIEQQLKDNLHWIRFAADNKLVVGSQARILYADARARIEIAIAFNQAIAEDKLGPVILGRDHHDVSGTDSPYRETSNIYDGSAFTADMAINNVIGDSFRGATWVSIHNGGGVGWGEVINGGFGMLLDGTALAQANIREMLHFDVNNGVARRSWAGNSGAQYAIQRAMAENKKLRVTFPEKCDPDKLKSYFR